MNTIEDFKNAPVGATATRADGYRVMKIDYYVERRWIVQNGLYLDDEEMAYWGCTLDSLPEPEPELPDWLDADAVVAFKDAVVDIWTHCISHPHDDGSGWTRRDPDSCTHWTELEHVTPLYPKETN